MFVKPIGTTSATIRNCEVLTDSCSSTTSKYHFHSGLIDDFLALSVHGYIMKKAYCNLPECLHHFDPDWISQQLLDCHEILHVLQRVKPAISNPPTFPPVPPWGWYLWLWEKCFKIYLNGLPSDSDHHEVDSWIYPVLWSMTESQQNLGHSHQPQLLCVVLINKGKHDDINYDEEY